MTADFSPVRLLLVTLAGWLNRQQQEVIEYLVEENRVLREQLRGRRVRFWVPDSEGFPVHSDQMGRWAP
jgi:hypothetical protein